MSATSSPRSTVGSLLAPAALALVFASTGCQDGRPGSGGPSPCAPVCADRACGADGCGGSCGECDDPLVCDSSGRCVDPSSACLDTCSSLGYDCGEVCGESCGTCTLPQHECQAGHCRCVPDCAGKSCGAPDGCGGTCNGMCPRNENCSDCPLRLSVVEKVIVEGRIQSLTLALDYQPGTGAPLPVMADVRVKVEGPATLQQVGLGEPVTAAGKELLVHPGTGKPYRVDANGTHQIVILSTRNTTTISPGRWLFLRFSIDQTVADKPATFALLKREQILAPPPADALLWGSDFAAPVVVWPEVGSEVGHDQ
ncbi:MAG: hypothetical protein V2A73_02220 [Pseudomonadota bacterium]